MSTLIINNSSATVSPGWIISKHDDLIWFIGSASAGYLSLLLLVALPSSTPVLAVIWWAVINNPHIFGTATRTYFDSNERRKLSKLLWLIIPVSALPIALVAAGLGRPLFVIALLWGGWHVAKQHFGLAMLYKRKNLERGDPSFDRRFILLSQMLPFLLFVTWYFKSSAWLLLLSAALAVQIAAAITYLWREVVKFRAGNQTNWPKLMLLALYLPLSWIALLCATSTDFVTGLLVFTLTTNIGHALQYHRLTWFHNRNRYHGRSDLSGFFSRSVVYYYAAGLGLFLLFCAVGSFLPSGRIELLIIGPTFMHYVLDTKIWRTRNDPELARALNL